MSRYNRIFSSYACMIIGISFLALIMPVCSPADTAEPTKIVDSQPVWSPNGKMIAFVSTRSGGAKNIWVIGTKGDGLRQITFMGDDECPSWSPDGKKIAFQSGGKLWTVDVPTSQLTQLTYERKAWIAPDWHQKDANKIVCAFESFSKEDHDLASINPQTCMTRESGRQIVRSREGSDDRPRWSPDGKCIAFIGQSINIETRESKWYLMTMRPDGTGLKTYCEVPRTASRPSWMDDGAAILANGGKVCDVATGKIKSLFADPIKDADVSRDSRRVVYCEAIDSSNQCLFVRNIDGTGKKQLTVP